MIFTHLFLLQLLSKTQLQLIWPAWICLLKVFILWPHVFLFLIVRMKNVMKLFMDIAGMYLMIARYL